MFQKPLFEEESHAKLEENLTLDFKLMVTI